MRAVSDGNMAAIVPQTGARGGARSGRSDFSNHLGPGGQAAEATDQATASSETDTSTSIKSGSAKDTSSSDTQDQPSDQAKTDSAAWLAAQMLAFKMKEPVQTVQADGSTETTIKTSVVTLPRSALEQGTATANGVPTLDPQTGLLVMKPAAGTPASGDLPVAPVDTPPADPATTPTDGTTPIDATPVDPTAVDPAPVDPAAVDPAAVDPAADPTAVDPNAVDPTAVDPAAVDPALVDPAAVEDPLPTDASADPAADPATAVGGQSKATGSAAAQLSVGKASLASSNNNGSNQSSDLFSGSQKDTGAQDAQLTSTTPTSSAVGFTAPAMQVQLAVPADRQLAPSLGAEVASTAQGMSALDRVLQASDQAQASTPVMKQLNVQLAPPELGNVSMHLSLQGNALEVHMSVDQGRTRSLIERDRHVITDSLAKVGYSITTLTIDQSSSTSNSNMSSGGQSFSSNSGYDGSSGRQSNGAGNFGTRGQVGQGLGFMDADGSTSGVNPARTGTGRGVFV